MHKQSRDQFASPAFSLSCNQAGGAISNAIRERHSICTPSVHSESHSISPRDREKRCRQVAGSLYPNPSRSRVRLGEYIYPTRRLEDAIDNVAANCGASTKYGSVAHLLAELLSVLFQLAWLSLARINLTAIGYHQRHIAVFCRGCRCRHRRSLFFQDCYVAAREYAFQACPLVAASPPYQELVSVHYSRSATHTVIVHVF